MDEGTERDDGNRRATGAEGEKASRHEVVRIAISGFEFRPPHVCIPPKTVVVWENQDDDLQHSLNERRGAWSSPVLDPHKRFSLAFDSRHTGAVFKYYCSFYPLMEASIRIVDDTLVVDLPREARLASEFLARTEAGESPTAKQRRRQQQTQHCPEVEEEDMQEEEEEKQQPQHLHHQHQHRRRSVQRGASQLPPSRSDGARIAASVVHDHGSARVASIVEGRSSPATAMTIEGPGSASSGSGHSRTEPDGHRSASPGTMAAAAEEDVDSMWSRMTQLQVRWFAGSFCVVVVVVVVVVVRRITGTAARSPHVGMAWRLCACLVVWVSS